jgi:hypothetical protein
VDAAAAVDVIYGKATSKVLINTISGEPFLPFTCLHSEKKNIFVLGSVWYFF